MADRHERLETIMELLDRECGGCKATMAQAQLEPCRLCNRYFCPDCAFRAYGRRFCSDDCSKTFFYGDEDDQDEPIGPDE